MNKVLGLFCVAACTAGCDPAMFYSIPGARVVRAESGRADEGRYAVMVADGIEARFHASIFTIHGRTEVQVVNTSASSVEFQPTPTVLVAGNGSRVPTTCDLPNQQKLSVAAGRTLTVHCKFEVPLRGFSYESEFRSVTLRQPGITVNGKAVDVVARMTGS